MKLKTVEVNGATYAVVAEGKPVFVNDDGTETPIDVPATVGTISRLNGEARGHREAKEKAEAALKAFGDLDPAKAREALDKLGSIDAKKLIDAGEVDKVKAEISKVYDAKLSEKDGVIAGLNKDLDDALIGGAFGRSAFVKDKVAIPVEFVQTYFGQRFSRENGKVVAKDANGNPIWSTSRPGEPADFDEALSALVNAHPQRDHILKGTGAVGSGAKPGNGSGGSRTMSQAELTKLGAKERAAFFAGGGSLTD